MDEQRGRGGPPPVGCRHSIYESIRAQMLITQTDINWKTLNLNLKGSGSSFSDVNGWRRIEDLSVRAVGRTKQHFSSIS